MEAQQQQEETQHLLSPSSTTVTTASNSYYGGEGGGPSTNHPDNPDHEINDNDEDDVEDGRRDFRSLGSSSFYQQDIFKKSRVGASNMMLTERHLVVATSDLSEDYDLVPEALAHHNMALVCDENLMQDSRHHDDNNDSNRPPRVYYHQSCFFQPSQKPEYVITISPQIYAAILEEWHQAQAIPCGLYYTCQGFGGGHSGEHVDIRLAAGLIATLLVSIAVVSSVT